MSSALSAGPTTATGRVVRVIGPVVDIEFPRGTIPELFNALHAEVSGLGESRTSPSRSRSTSATVWSGRSRCSRPTA